MVSKFINKRKKKSEKKKLIKNNKSKKLIKNNKSKKRIKNNKSKKRIKKYKKKIIKGGLPPPAMVGGSMYQSDTPADAFESAEGQLYDYKGQAYWYNYTTGETSRAPDYDNQAKEGQLPLWSTDGEVAAVTQTNTAVDSSQVAPAAPAEPQQQPQEPQEPQQPLAVEKHNSTSATNTLNNVKTEIGYAVKKAIRDVFGMGVSTKVKSETTGHEWIVSHDLHKE